MKIVVPIKRVVDPYAKVRVSSGKIDVANLKHVINPFCEIALEQAIQLREQGIATEIIVVTIGSTHCQEQLRAALALGADSAYLIDCDESPEPLTIAKLLKEFALVHEPQLIILGKQSVDSDNNQVPQMLAALMDYPLASFASNVDCQQDSVTVTREFDGGLVTVTLTLPAIISTDLRLNTPRYASLPNIMKAKQKPLTVIPADVYDVPLAQQQTTLEILPPPQRQAGIKVESVDELINKLKHEAKVIE